MDIPYRVTLTTGSTATSGVNGTTAALFYGFKPDGCIVCPAGIPGCNLPAGSASAYAGSEGIFRQTPPISATSNSWLAMMLTSSNLTQAKAVVDRGVVSDGAFPVQPVFLAKSYDPARNVRYVLFDNAIFDTRLRGNYAMQSTNTYKTDGLGNMLGFQVGVQQFNLYGFPFVAGAMADDLTSFSGDLFGSPDHTRVLDFINNGVTGSYGTVIEPCNYLEKFPSPQNYFYQSRGFTIAECYYQSVTNPYEGILVGEPLSAPFALPCAGAWNGLPAGAVLAGNTNLSLQFNAPDATRPVAQVDLFVDGTFSQTLTNIVPRANNILYVTLNGVPTNYTIPASATLKTIASNLTARLNQNSYSNATKVAAFAHGDRIELHSLAAGLTGDQIPISVSNFPGSATVLTTFLLASRTNFLDSPAQGLRNFVVTNMTFPGDFLQLSVTKTNGSVVTVGMTNTSGSTDTAAFVQALLTAANTNSALTGMDGVVCEDFVNYNIYQSPPVNGAEFNLLAHSPGWSAAQLQAQLTGSITLGITPGGNVSLEENLNDLQPRNHLYVTAGLTNLAFSFSLNTTTQADGWHELTAVAYEGSHVRTQKRITQKVRIQNTPLSAAFNCLLCDVNTALEATLQFSVTANTNTISRIELFSTGGSWGVVNNQSSATFSLAGTNLGLGLHPFYAMVTRNDGQQYRTETKWIRLLGDEPPFALAIAGSAPTVTWPATAGRRYEVLGATNATNIFLLRDAIVPTNSPGQWSETNNSAPNQLYRVRSSP
jgi:hypothetical protein